eukprot:scaffold121930_cov30-Tisochrysis_lutea.AAC.4
MTWIAHIAGAALSTTTHNRSQCFHPGALSLSPTPTLPSTQQNEQSSELPRDRLCSIASPVSKALVKAATSRLGSPFGPPRRRSECGGGTLITWCSCAVDGPGCGDRCDMAR